MPSTLRNLRRDLRRGERRGAGGEVEEIAINGLRMATLNRCPFCDEVMPKAAAHCPECGIRVRPLIGLVDVIGKGGAL
jgi:hypothetical protein